MKIEKLPSGHYRVRQQIDGVRRSAVFDHRPNSVEILDEFARKYGSGDPHIDKLTFYEAANKYIEIKDKVLSPSTIVGYRAYLRNIPYRFTDLCMVKITNVEIQRTINEMSATRSPKYIRNIHGFISAVLGMFNPSLTISTTLPQKRLTDRYIPSDDDIKIILQEAQGTIYEIPIMLACFGMRRSEICALTLDDIKGNQVTINKVLVLNDKKEWVVKNTTKTDASTRTIYVPDVVVNKIMEQGYIYEGHPNTILKWLGTVQDRNGLPHFSLHSFRHHFASKLSAMNVDVESILALGGWGTDYVMKNVYRHAMEDKVEAAKRATIAKFSGDLFS